MSESKTPTEPQRPTISSQLSRLSLLVVSLLSFPLAASPALEQAIRSGDLSAAREIIHSTPYSSEIGRKWDSARVDLLGGHSARALETLEELISARPDSSNYRLWFSRALLARATEVSPLRRPFMARRAVSELERSVALDPRNDDAAIDLILVHLRIPILGDGEDAAAEISSRLTRRNAPAAGFARGILAYERDDWRNAENELRTAAESLDDPRRALFWLGYVYQRLGRWDEAFATHQRLLELSPNDPRVWYEFARTADFSGERVELGERMLNRYLPAQLPSGARTKDEAKELLQKLSAASPN